MHGILDMMEEELPKYGIDILVLSERTRKRACQLLIDSRAQRPPTTGRLGRGKAGCGSRAAAGSRGPGNAPKSA